jgi:hypothetical protein
MRGNQAADNVSRTRRQRLARASATPLSARRGIFGGSASAVSSAAWHGIGMGFTAACLLAQRDATCLLSRG